MRDVLCGACACASLPPPRSPPATATVASSAWRRLQSLHLLLIRRWAQMEALPQSMQMLLTWLCSQMEAPPQYMTHEMYWLRKGPGAIPG